MKLNLGCGSTKIKGCINLDVEKSCKPDKVFDFIKKPLPYKPDTVEAVYLFHTIEHIQKKHHTAILSDIHRVLKPGGKFIVSYPEFKKIYKNWETDRDGKRKFWEATIYGRQLYPSDHHVCIMDSVDFSTVLMSLGFHNIVIHAEPVPNEFNSFITCVKGKIPENYEGTLARLVSNTIIRKPK